MHLGPCDYVLANGNVSEGNTALSVQGGRRPSLHVGSPLQAGGVRDSEMVELQKGSSLAPESALGGEPGL